MNLLDIQTAINNLKQKHKIFHSEADFQFSMAWELQQILPDAKVRLEYCPPFAREMHIDIYVIDENRTYPIELKYKTKTIETIVDNEYFNLKNHGAQDLGRYDFLYDICRIERMKKLDKQFRQGFAIILTNDSAYWKPPASNNTVDVSFRIHEGRLASGNLNWTKNAGVGTIKGRDSFELQNEYEIKWHSFSRIEEKFGEFNYCLIEVK